MTIEQVSPGDLEKSLRDNLAFRRGTSLRSASAQDVYHALAWAVNDILVERKSRTMEAHYAANPRFVYYLSAEYMLGKQLEQNLLYAGVEEAAREAVEALGVSYDDIAAIDVEPGLGNGGLGRLAACLLDSMATLDIPAVGYGIRYEFGIFKQTFAQGAQVEVADDWTFYGNPWEFNQPDDSISVGFYGHTEPDPTDPTGFRKIWVPGETVLAEPSHMLVPGYGTDTVNIVRLWRARASRETFNLARFAEGNYGDAVADMVRSENISKVLYPDDSTAAGRELRLKQQYFLVSASLRDIIRRYRFRNDGWDGFPEKVAIQLNDTHPVLGVAELMRLLVDEFKLGWGPAAEVTRRTFAYTCHTLLPEALETWPTATLANLLPRHLEIIQLINHYHLREMAKAGQPDDLVPALSLFAEGPEQRVRMANLAVVGSYRVNGVAALHSQLLQETTLHDYAQVWPEKFTNVTNGVTPRRFLRIANPELSALISEALGGEGWLTDLDLLRGLEEHVDDASFQQRWRECKLDSKRRLSAYTHATLGIRPDPSALTDVMIKRFHEYKRQILKVLHTVTLYHRVKAGIPIVPRTVVFGGKAAPSYHAAKRVMRLINAVAATIEADHTVRDHLRVAFIPDYNVTRNQLIIPAANLSEQISMAGKEASGTGNMKLSLNGALTIGTLDGANVEIREQVGDENFFLFGLDAPAALSLRNGGTYQPRDYYDSDEELRSTLDAIQHGSFGWDLETFGTIVHGLLGYDEYLALADYRSYVDAQDRVEQVWADPVTWTRMSIINTARCGFFSSDRTIRDYCERIWRVEPVPIPASH